MVADESAVLPDARAVDSDDDESSFAFEDIAGDYRPRANRPSQDEGWMDTDHYNEDTPSESHSAAEWRQAHRDLEPIMVNGAIVEQWRHAQGAIAQVIARMRVVIGNDNGSVCREDLSCHFYGAASPLFTCLQRRLKWDHRLFCKFVLTGMRLSANNWNAAQLYDKEHPQLNVDECMPEAQYHQCWRAISACGLPNTREDSANGEVPLWEEMQTALNTLLRTFVVECRSHDPERPLRDADPPASPIVIRNPEGVRGINAVVQRIGMATHGETPQRAVKKFYEKESESDSFLAARRVNCLGCPVRPLAKKPGKDGAEPSLQVRRMTCALCGRQQARAQCTVCHHWFHDVTGFLPPGEEELVAVPMGKRERDGEEEYVLAKRTCFDV